MAVEEDGAVVRQVVDADAHLRGLEKGIFERLLEGGGQGLLAPDGGGRGLGGRFG